MFFFEWLRSCVPCVVDAVVVMLLLLVVVVVVVGVNVVAAL